MNLTQPTNRSSASPFSKKFAVAVLTAIVILPIGTSAGIYLWARTIDSLFAEAVLVLLLVATVVSLGLAAFVWGAWTIGLRHPLYDSGYRDWLANSPWRPGAPLVRGPIRLGLRNAVGAVVLGVLAWLATLPNENLSGWLLLAPATAMLAGAALIGVMANTKIGAYQNLYSAVIAMLLTAALLPPAWSIVVVPVVVYATSVYGNHRAIQTFPWPDPPDAPRDLGWPFSALLNEPKDIRTTFAEASLRATLVSAAVATLLWRAPTDVSPDAEDPTNSVLMLVGIGGFFLAVLRLGAYGPAICPRLCWGHRIGAGQWFVPKHDVVFLVAGAILLAGSLLPLGLTILGTPPWVAASLGAGLAVFITFGLGPSVADLHYTGPHAMKASIPAVDRQKRRMVQAHC
ncbi:MAG: hypothetical protein KDA37_14490 [Planctomycetales bacterium]|nr:hypothetical protein [Planctomycetales bacterium]